jgi:hypothetical protein
MPQCSNKRYNAEIVALDVRNSALLGDDDGIVIWHRSRKKIEPARTQNLRAIRS